MSRPLRNWFIQEARQTYTVGDDGLPVRLYTELRVEALALLEKIVYVFDTDKLSITGIDGCEADKVVRDEHEPDKYWSVTLELDPPLERGEVRDISYRTAFSYASPPPNEIVQSGGALGIKRVRLSVHFQPRKLPRVVRQVLRDPEGTVLKTTVLGFVPASFRVESEAISLPPDHQFLIEWEW